MLRKIPWSTGTGSPLYDPTPQKDFPLVPYRGLARCNGLLVIRQMNVRAPRFQHMNLSRDGGCPVPQFHLCLEPGSL